MRLPADNTFTLACHADCPVKNVKYTPKEFTLGTLVTSFTPLIASAPPTPCSSQAQSLATCAFDGSLGIKTGCCSIACSEQMKQVCGLDYLDKDFITQQYYPGVLAVSTWRGICCIVDCFRQKGPIFWLEQPMGWPTGTTIVCISYPSAKWLARHSCHRSHSPAQKRFPALLEVKFMIMAVS